MGRLVPVWLLLLCLLLGSLLTVAFGWSVKSAIDDTSSSAHLRRLGEVSIAIASFPDLVGYFFWSIGADPDTYFRVRRTSVASSEFHPVRMKSDIHVEGLTVRANEAALTRESGWRILVGIFVIDGELNHAALVLSPEFEIVKVWVLREEDIQNQEPRSKYLKYIHGFALLTDGSIIFTFDGGVSIQRFDRCNRKIWSTGGIFDHAVVLDEDEAFVWTVSNNDYSRKGSEVVKVATSTGEIVWRFSMDDVGAANPTIDILGILQRELILDENPNPRNTAHKWEIDPFHLNDVDPLPAALAEQFKGFTAGDLLLSARNLNLVFVVDPETLRIKWWQSGAWRRQHDPDWQPSGEITVYDNRMGRDYSRIVSIDPTSNSTRVVFDGRANDFYSIIRGKHQITKRGNILITSPHQGRVFEVDPNGQVVFEVLNNKPGTQEFGYLLSEAIFLPSEAFDFEKEAPCAN